MKIFKDLEADISIDYDSIYEDLRQNITKLNDFDKWILYELNEIVSYTEEFMDKFML
jgi:isoleucyl-tRNA synthetase